ncbi:MAG TPA: hypothetical protein VN633_13050 [Bryobacteraceae bacterium]|nr:hypothetical protein [Bryobacteraceae bacterium]
MNTKNAGQILAAERLYNCGYQGNNWQAVANLWRDVRRWTFGAFDQ